MSEPSVFPTPPPEVELVQAELAEMAATIDLDAPWDAEHAGSWDAITYYAVSARQRYVFRALPPISS